MAAAKDGEGPHWARPWGAGLGLGRLLARSARLEGLEVWDVGCGLGTAGLAAGLRGARVVFVDRDGDALAFAAHNARRNGLTDFEVRSFDWSAEAPATSAAMLLLADVCYSFRQAREVGRLVETCRARSIDVLIADPWRPTANDLWRELVGRGDARGGVWEGAQEVAPAEAGGARVPVRFLGLDLGGGAFRGADPGEVPVGGSGRREAAPRDPVAMDRNPSSPATQCPPAAIPSPPPPLQCDPAPARDDLADAPGGLVADPRTAHGAETPRHSLRFPSLTRRPAAGRSKPDTGDPSPDEAPL